MDVRTSAACWPGRNGNVCISVIIAVESFEVFPDLVLLTGRQIGQAEGRLVAGGALSIGGLQRCGQRWPYVRHVRPSRRVFCCGAGDLDNSEVVHGDG